MESQISYAAGEIIKIADILDWLMNMGLIEEEDYFPHDPEKNTYLVTREFLIRNQHGNAKR